MKKLSLPTWLQIIYCICCVLVVIVMNLYTAYFPSEFSDTCFKIGEIMAQLCTFIPLGIICCILNTWGYVTTDRHKEAKHKYLAWVILGPILTAFAWCLAIGAFVARSGGV